MCNSISVKTTLGTPGIPIIFSRRLPYRSLTRGVARFRPEKSGVLVDLDVLPVQLIDESRLLVDQLIHFLYNMSHFDNTTFRIDFVQTKLNSTLSVNVKFRSLQM